MTRKELKALIKECLVEILAEGLGQGLQESVQARPRAVQQPQQTPQRRVASNTSYGQPQPRQAPPRQVQHQVISQVTKDPIMASIFADTMNKTLVEQSQAETMPGRQPSMAGGDAASRAMHAADPVEVFGDEVAARWAEAAFAPSRGRSVLPGMSSDFAAEMMAMNHDLKKT